MYPSQTYRTVKIIGAILENDGMIVFVSFALFCLLFIRFSRYRSQTVAFFHPYCDAGGGGEKVLWEAVRAIKTAHPEYSIFIYTGDDAAEDAILARAVSRFDLKLPDDIRLIKLKYRWLVEASTWPYFTLAGQSIGSIILALEAVIKESWSAKKIKKTLIYDLF